MAPGGGAPSADRFAAELFLRSPCGRERAKLEIEVCASGVAFGSVACTTQISSTWIDLGTSGAVVGDRVTGLAANEGDRGGSRFRFVRRSPGSCRRSMPVPGSDCRAGRGPRPTFVSSASRGSCSCSRPVRSRWPDCSDDTSARSPATKNSGPRGFERTFARRVLGSGSVDLAREGEVEGCASSDCALCPDSAAMTPNDALNGREPDAVALEVGRGMQTLKRAE